MKESLIQSHRFEGITHAVIDLKESLRVIDLRESLIQSHRFEGITHTESEI